MYSEKFTASIAAVEAAREANIAYEPARMSAKEKEELEHLTQEQKANCVVIH